MGTHTGRALATSERKGSHGTQERLEFSPLRLRSGISPLPRLRKSLRCHPQVRTPDLQKVLQRERRCNRFQKDEISLETLFNWRDRTRPKGNRLMYSYFLNGTEKKN